MTAAEALLALSPLPSGTAAAHLLAIELTGGGGDTIYIYRDRIVPQSDCVAVRIDDAVATLIEDAGADAVIDDLDLAVRIERRLP